MFGDEVQKIPLRHQGDKLASRRQMGKIDHLESGAADYRTEFARLLMRPSQKFVQNAQFMHYFERRRMYCVAAKVPQKMTHEKMLVDCDAEMTEFLKVMDALHEKATDSLPY